MSPPDLRELITAVDPVRLTTILRASAASARSYLHWDELRHRPPPEDLSPEEWWLGVKLGRMSPLRALPLADKEGRRFTFATPDELLRQLHHIDKHAAGQITVAEEVTNPASRDRYIVSSLMEEAITSSQLEGASTTREVARQMLRSGRAPRTTSEQMIVNNFSAMTFVRERANDPLTPHLVLELHRVVTAGTLEDESKAGVFRDADDEIVIEDEVGTVLHVPPAAGELGERLERLCAFANSTSEDAFVHPVVRAMILHFMIGYDHPFVDGNGRTARALFYWAMLSRGYWLAEYVSISRILRKASGQYARAFLYTETDDADVTYFLLHQARVFQLALRDLQEHLQKKVREVREVAGLLRGTTTVNHRQVALLGHALRYPGMRYTIQSHRRSHNVVYQTARTDLLDLADRNLLEQGKVGRSLVFVAPPDLGQRLAAIHDARRE